MTLTEQQIKLLTHLKANQITAISQYAADACFYVTSLAQVIAKHHPGTKTYVFSLAEGLQSVSLSQAGQELTATDDLGKPQGADPLLHYLHSYHEYDGDGIFIFQDLHQFLKPPIDRAVVSYLRTIATNVRQSDSFKRIILLGQEIELNSELIRFIPLIENSLPDRDKRNAALRYKLQECSIPLGQNFRIEPIVKATAGLTMREIYNGFDYYVQRCVYLGQELELDAITNSYISYKTKLLRALKIEVSQPKIQNFGGHGALKEWLNGVKAILNPAARDFGIPFPKGCLLGGVSGVGKTLIAESISSSWYLPLIKLSIPALKGSLVGESEANLKRALELIHSIEGVVLIDEVEKAISGAGTDSSGVTGGMLSILLGYMQSQTQHFVICTANHVSQIPAELMRKGRLDEVWFAGLPNTKEREEILRIHFFQQNRVAESHASEVEQFIPELASRTDYFSGSELAALVTQGLTNIYLAGRAANPTSADFLPLASTIIPLAKAQPEQYQAVLEWGEKARNTSIQANYLED